MTEFLDALHFALAQPPILITFSALLGLVFGGFSTVAGDRLGQLAVAEDEGIELEQEMGLWWPASRCENCGRPLSAIERAPGIGWFAVKGRCKQCGFKVPVSAPMAEWGCAVLFALIAWKFGPTWSTLAYMFAGWSFIAMTLADVKHMALPDRLTLPLLWVGLLASALNITPVPPDYAIMGAAAGFGFLWLLQEAYFRLRGIIGIGGGDVKLLGAIGAWVGIEYVFLTAVFAALLGLLVFAVLGLLRLYQDQHKPFGPMLAAAGCWATLRPEDIQAVLDWMATLVT
ncbi:MAG: prepilin peptidase [Alphaproteobacteria bacterium]|nr:prepilin peptidase [Alphaproteobacteria bacterium SS10]